MGAAGSPKPYSYNVLFFLPKGVYTRNIVVTNRAGIFQRGVVFEGKLPAIVATGG